MNRQSKNGVGCPARLDAGSISKSVPIKMTAAKLRAITRVGDENKRLLWFCLCSKQFAAPFFLKI